MEDRLKRERKASSRLIKDLEYADDYTIEGKRKRGQETDASYSDEFDDDDSIYNSEFNKDDTDISESDDSDRCSDFEIMARSDIMM